MKEEGRVGALPRNWERVFGYAKGLVDRAPQPGMRCRMRQPLPVFVVQRFRVLQGITTRWHGAYQRIEQREGLRTCRIERMHALGLHCLQKRTSHTRSQSQHFIASVGQDQAIQHRTGGLVTPVDPFNHHRQPVACDLNRCL